MRYTRREGIAEVGSGRRAYAVVEGGDEWSLSQAGHRGGHDVEPAAAQRRIKDRAARANHRLLVQFESQPDSRPEVVIVTIIVFTIFHAAASDRRHNAAQGDVPRPQTRNLRESGGDLFNWKLRLRVEVLQPVESLRVPCLEIPPQTEIERQTAVELPIILDEERKILALKREIGRAHV